MCQRLISPVFTCLGGCCCGGVLLVGVVGQENVGLPGEKRFKNEIKINVIFQSSVCPVCQKHNITVGWGCFVFPVASTDSTFLSSQLKRRDCECLVNQQDNLKVKTQALFKKMRIYQRLRCQFTRKVLEGSERTISCDTERNTFTNTASFSAVN